MSQLEPRIEAIRKEYGLAKDDFWELPQKKGTWIAKHSALEVVSVCAGIWWTDVQIVEADSANGIAVMIVKGTLDKRVEWATGEASPKNNKNAYPWAMAEKRAKDRVILKLVGLHGLVYSEDEAEDFKAPTEQSKPVDQRPKQKSVAERKAIWVQLMDDLNAEAPKGWRKMIEYMKHSDTRAAVEDLGDYKDQFLNEARDLTKLVRAGEEATGEPVAKAMSRVLPNFDNLQSGDPLDKILKPQGEQ